MYALGEPLAIVFFASFFVLFRVLPGDWAIYVSGRCEKKKVSRRARAVRGGFGLKSQA